MSLPEDGVLKPPRGSKTYSYVYISLVLLLILASGVGAVYYGFVQPDVDITVTMEVGWIVEYSIAGVVALLFLWTFAQMVNIIGVGFVTSLFSAIARIADNYSLPETEDNPPVVRKDTDEDGDEDGDGDGED